MPASRLDAVPVPHIKGAVVASFMLWFVKRYGEVVTEDKLGRLPPQVRANLDMVSRHTPFDNTWYRAEDVHTLLETVFVSDKERRVLIEEGARAAAQETLHGVYGMLFRWLMNPERYAGFGKLMWDRYYDHGSISHDLDTSERRMVSKIHDWGAHHPLICDLIRPTTEFIHESMGLSGVCVERVACVSHNGSHCEWITTWGSEGSGRVHARAERSGEPA